MTVAAGVQLSFRASAAAGLALTLAKLLQLQFPIYALIAAVIVTELSAAETQRLGKFRLAGTMVGSVLGALLSSVFGSGPTAIVLGILGAMLACYALSLERGAKVAGYACAIGVLDFSAHPWSYAFYRSIETALGIGTAVAISALPRVFPTRSE